MYLHVKKIGGRGTGRGPFLIPARGHASDPSSLEGYTSDDERRTSCSRTQYQLTHREQIVTNYWSLVRHKIGPVVSVLAPVVTNLPAIGFSHESNLARWCVCLLRCTFFAAPHDLFTLRH